MADIQYVGEHLWLGQIGHVCIVLGFVTSIIALLGYSKYTNSGQEGDSSWRTVGRWAYGIHIGSVATAIGLIFFAMINKYFEYAYVYEHVSEELPMRYIVSAFWEGQEGSFLLWMIWHLVLGAIIMKKGGFWESPVMAIIALAQVFLSSMLLGVHVEIGDWITKFGSNPFVLLRDTMNIPLFSNAEYLTLIKGDGLNPLLQNYWMTIHPPVTFLGFASTIMPLAFAVAGMWTGKYKEWLVPALPWALFSGFILGTGILMGSLWAYEALSFGGYWNWDPVENAVLVPWLTLVAGIHTHLIARSTGYSIRPTVFFYIISFVLIVYSTYLTRSGILGDTSAHAFTEMGLEKQLIAFLGFFLLWGMYLLIKHYKHIPTKQDEEAFTSREFWMFIGSLVLLFSGVLISVSTSLPVFNSIMTSFVDPTYVGKVIADPVPHYDKYQIWISVFVALLSSATVYLRYGEKNWSAKSGKFWTQMGGSAVVAALLTLLFGRILSLDLWQYKLLCFTGFFAVVSNLNYLITVLKGNLKLGSSAMAHFGFGLMLIGILGSGANKSFITSSPWVFGDLFENEQDGRELIQLIQNKPFFSQGYMMTYEKDTLINRLREYTIDFKYTKTVDGPVIEQFKLKPTGVYSNDFSKMVSFNPDTKHYIHKDIFSVVRAVAPTKSDVQIAREFEDTLSYQTYEAFLGDTIVTSEGNHFYLKELTFDPSHEEYKADENDFGVGVEIVAWNNKRDSSYYLSSALSLRGNLVYKYPYIEEDIGIRVRPAEQLMDRVFTPEYQLDYQQQVLKSYGSFEYGGATVALTGFDNAPTNRSYQPEDKDIAVGAKMKVMYEGKSYDALPIYIIRGGQPLAVKAYVPEVGLHIRFASIDPEKEEFTFYVAKDEQRNVPYKIPIEIAENVPRTDYIILQATIFPGISMFWVGALLMMIGLLIAMFQRRAKKRT